MTLKPLTLREKEEAMTLIINSKLERLFKNLIIFLQYSTINN